jgi:choline dehydrogenase
VGPGNHYDVVVLGGGSAGCVVASRLSECAERTVCLVEAGPDYGAYDGGGWPAEILDARVTPHTHDWGFGEGRSLLRARLVGGCSAHNACFVVRGAVEDYDEWAALGNEGWSFAEIRPHLERAELMIKTRAVEPEEISPVQRAVIEAAGVAGIPTLDDLNRGDITDGIAPVPLNAAGTVRWNAAFAYLDPSRGRSNLTILDRALVDRLRLRGDRAAGVIVHRDGEVLELEADLFVLATGAYASPAILLRSGIGSEQELGRLAIKTAISLPGVGGHLVDHPGVGLQFALTGEMQDATARFAQARPLFRDQCILRSASRRRSDGFSALHLVPRTSDADTGGGYRADVGVFALKPASSGRVTLQSADPGVLPLIDNGFLSDPGGEDIALLMEGTELMRELARLSPLDRAVTGELDPMAAGDESPEDFARRRVKGYDHPVGSCKMGLAGDELAVVDARGRVHCCQNVYVADASIMPTMPRANTHLTVLAVAELIAERLGGGDSPARPIEA